MSQFNHSEDQLHFLKLHDNLKILNVWKGRAYVTGERFLLYFYQGRDYKLYSLFSPDGSTRSFTYCENVPTLKKYPSDIRFISEWDDEILHFSFVNDRYVAIKIEGMVYFLADQEFTNKPIKNGTDTENLSYKFED